MKKISEILPLGSYHVISVIGGGGKTSCIKMLAEEFASAGKKVVISTTTHILYPNWLKDAVYLDACHEQIRSALMKYNIICVASLLEGNKLKSPSKKTLDFIEKHCDVLLIEADGSKHLPLKYASEKEPAIYEHTDCIIQIAGLSGLNHDINEVCHRHEMAMAEFGWQDHQMMDDEMLEQLIQHNFSHVSKEIPQYVLLNQSDIVKSHLNYPQISMMQKGK